MEHNREHRRILERTRKANWTPEEHRAYLDRRLSSQYKKQRLNPDWNRARLDQRNTLRLERRQTDPSYREADVAHKRRKRFEAGIAGWCTRAYLQNAKREDETLTKALWAWLKANRKPKTREEKLACAREAAKLQYWRNPEAQRRRIQAFKHSRPDYRIRWNETRGEREAEASDGTITGEAVKALFAASKCCPYCADPYKRSRRSLDHIIPLSKADGRKLHSLKNVLVCCRSCNTKKRTKGLTQFLEELKAAKRKGVAKSHPDTVPGLFECRSA